MKKKFLFLKFFIFLFYVIIPDLKSDNKFDGVYKSEFLLGVNRFYYIDDKCPSKLPITVKLIVEGNNITGNISNNLSNGTQCSNYQKAQINGEIDDSGNIVKIKFDHDTKAGQKEDAYAIEGNLKGELILKSKLRALYRRDAKFFLTEQDLSNNKKKLVEQSNIKDFKNESKSLNEKTQKELEELKEKVRRLEEEKFREIEEKSRELKEKERLRKIKEEKSRELKEKERLRKIEEEKSKLLLY